MSEIKHIPDARSLAVQVLMHVSPSTTLQASLDKGLRNTTLPYIDHALCTELVYGTMRYAISLDVVLDSLMKKRSALPLQMQMVMRVASYALLYLDRVPHHATVNWAVNHIKREFGQTLSKVCNATLRSLIRLESAPLKQDFYKKPEHYYSVPSWLYKLFVNSLGEEDASKVLWRLLQRPKIALRLNPRHKQYDALRGFLSQSAAQDDVQEVGWSGFVFHKGAVPREILDMSVHDLHLGGAFSWQASGSQYVLKECFSKVPELKFAPLWDACCGQGGKSLALIEQGLDVPLASDVYMPRLNLLSETARRLKIPCPHIVCADASRSLMPHFSGNILLDVPCSGFGTMARRPEMRLWRSQNDVLNLVGLQKKILRSAFTQIQAGNYIIYMTCTLHDLENEKLIEKFLQENTNATCVHTWHTPHNHPYMEGMYAAVIQKK